MHRARIKIWEEAEDGGRIQKWSVLGSIWFVNQGCACSLPCYRPLKMRQALAYPVVFSAEGRGENRRSLASIGWGRVAKVKRGTGSVFKSNYWRGRGWGSSLPDHPECDKITVVTSRCFSVVITWRSSRLGINHRHLISGNTTCQYRQTMING